MKRSLISVLCIFIICIILTWLYDLFINDVSMEEVYILFGAMTLGAIIGLTMKYLTEKAKQH